MKYKVGEKVRVKSFNWYKENLSNPDGVDFVFEMSKYCGLIGVITGVSLESNTYKIYINGDDTAWYWCDSMLEDLMEEPCGYCNSAKAIVSDQKHEEAVVFINDDELCLEYGDSLHCEKINYCPMCGHKLN